jgi:hypothetical protein
VPEQDIAAAERLLAAIPEYAWLVQSGKQFYTVSEVSAALDIGVGAVRALAERGDIAGAVLYGTQIGWRLPRSGLMLYLARLQQRGTDGAAAER